MLRQMTSLTCSSDVLGEFMGQYSRVRAIDAFIGIVAATDSSGPGAYKVTYAVRACTAVNGRVPHTRDMRPEALAKLPTSRGGMLGSMIEGTSPKMFFELDPIEHELAGPLLAGLRTCMAIPIYDGDAVTEWTLAFSNLSPQSVQPRDVGHAAMTANLLGAANRNIDLLNQIRRLNDALASQIEGIVRVQQSLLPNKLPVIPEFDIATSYITSDAAGGDYFDFFALPEGLVGLLIADVSGHGPAAATIMAMLHAILHAYPAGPDLDPAAMMTFANDRLYDAGLEGSFVTAFFAILNPATGQLRYCNCGHNPPRLRQLPLARSLGPVPANESAHHLFASILAIDHGPTIPLGILPNLPEAATHIVHLHRGDTLVLYTDGITEAFNEAHEMFGEPGLDAALAAQEDTEDNSPAEQTIEAIYRGLFLHRGLRPIDDDQTLVVLHFRSQATATPVAAGAESTLVAG